MAKIYFGTAGWSYKDWIGSFYPENQSAKFDWLEFYSRYFNCVEVNTTYYVYVSDKVVRSWLRKVEALDDFTFTIKLHQDFTHKRNYDQQKIKAVNYILEMLDKSGRLGCLLIQFPYSFYFNNANADYLRELKELFQSFNCFVEVRHKSWINKNAIGSLQQLDLGFTTIDQPQIGEAVAFEPIVINQKAYIRFHGRNAEAWKRSVNNFQSRQGRGLTDGKGQTYEERSERYDYLYSPGELVEFEQIIRPLLNIVKELYIIFNNHPKGEAVVNCFQLISMLENRKAKIPKTTLTKYPQLTEIAV